MSEVTGYQLTKAFYRLVGDSEEIQKAVMPHHQSLYTWICELRNRIQIYDPKAEILDLPREYTMKMTFIGSPVKLKSCIEDLIKWGVIELVTKGKNDYTGSTKVKLSCSFMNKYCTANEQLPNSNSTATEQPSNTIKTDKTEETELTVKTEENGKGADAPEQQVETVFVKPTDLTAQSAPTTPPVPAAP
ncbi:hypothetical protein, partial [Larkinella terrae]